MSMTSPAPLPPSSHPTTLPTPQQQQRVSEAHEPTTLGAVGNGLSTEMTDVEGQSKDAIAEGKQKAKAVLAASGVQVDGIVDKMPPSKQPKLGASKLSRSSSPSKTNGTSHTGNGASESRKRPRSGSRTIPQGETTSQDRPRPTTQKLLLEQYVTRDQLHTAALHSQNTAHMDLIRSKRKDLEHYQGLRRERHTNAAAVFGYGYAGYGNGHTDGKPNVVYPFQRKRPGSRRTRALRIPRKEMSTQAEQEEELIPVRLDIDWDKIKLRDTFTWNLHDRVISPDLFAEQLVEDFKIPPEVANSLQQSVSQQVTEQIQDFYPQVLTEEEALDPKLPYSAYKDDEMRILVKLNITIGQHTLVDQFEWEINNPLNSPEEFARQMTCDLALSGEFTTAIAHCIREQSQLFTRSLYITGHPFDGRPIEDSDLKAAFLPSPLTSVFRPSQHAKDFTPYLYELNEVELERAETSLSREQRRQKRSVNRRGGPALPDLKDRQRTVRTLVVSSVLPGSAETPEESRLFKRSSAAANRSSRRVTRPGDEDSEESESDDSNPASPAMLNVGSGTARTRNMRGAASAAQAAMRANYGRSATPEASMNLHHHETRISARRFGGRDAREESNEPPSLLLRLKLPRERYRQWNRDRKVALKAAQQQQHNTPFRSPQPQQGGSARASMGPPPSTPGSQNQAQASEQSTTSTGPSTAQQAQQQYGAVELAGPPQPGQPGVGQAFIYSYPWWN